jgi:hypothetical protein
MGWVWMERRLVVMVAVVVVVAMVLVAMVLVAVVVVVVVVAAAAAAVVVAVVVGETHPDGVVLWSVDELCDGSIVVYKGAVWAPILPVARDGRRLRCHGDARGDG